MTDSERQQELTRLQKTLAEISRQLEETGHQHTHSQAELKNNLADYWESFGGNKWDEAQMIELVERQRSISTVIHRQHMQLQQALSSPYFGRFDFIEHGYEQDGPEEIYIGITTLTEQQSNEILIYDWRAPVSGMFYDFERGSAWYNAPVGKLEGIITRKRQYRIVAGTMRYLFDSDLKIDDEILQELLSKNADRKMQTIVTSIQREQNQVIRNSHDKILMVQGPAGSGKTSIALHRIAYLLYQDRQTLNANNILILSPNALFSDYISSVLPQMGEENVRQTTFQKYITAFAARLPIQIESRADHLETILSQAPHDKQAVDRKQAIRFKTSPAFVNVIDAYLEHYQHQLIAGYPDIVFEGQLIFSKADWHTYYFTNYSFLPPLRRLTKIRDIIDVRLRPLTQQLRQQKETEIAETGEEINEKTIRAMARLAARQQLSALNNTVDRLTCLQPLNLYRRLFSDRTLPAALAAQLDLPPEWPSICRQTRSWLNRNILPYEDAGPFLYFQGVLTGFPVKKHIKYLIVDEAQDYTIFEYRILSCLFPNCSWTVLGDPAQTIHPALPPADFSQLAAFTALSEARRITLSRSYRSTRQIREFCNALLGDVAPAQGIDRNGHLPQLAAVDPTQPIAVGKLAQAFIAAGCNSAAIICKTVHQASELYAALDGAFSISLITTEDDALNDGIIIIPVYLAKGLEFDGVVVYHASADQYQLPGERNLLYTICTRALHRLAVCWHDDPSPFISAIETTLYQTN